METKENLVGRWNGFLHKIENRFNESLQHAEEACIDQLKNTDYDYYTVIRSWTGMKAQVQDLIEKIDHTWHNNVEPQMKAVGDFWMDEGKKAAHTTDRLNNNLCHFQRQLEGKLSKIFYAHAIETANKDFFCTQCNAKLKIKKNLFRAHYVTCQFCKATNTFEPDTKYAQIGWNVIDNIAHQNSKEAYQNMQTALANIQDMHPPVPDRLWNNYKATYFKYWETFFKEKAKLDASAKERYDEDMHRKQIEYKKYEDTYK